MVAGKICVVCGDALSAAAFNRSVRSADGLARVCRACTNARRRRGVCSSSREPRPSSSAKVLATALRTGDTKAVQTLLHLGMIPDWSWVCETMRAGHLTFAEWLLESRVEQNVFTKAATGNTQALIRRLRRVPEDARLVVDMMPMSRQVTPLHVGCASDWRSHQPEWMAIQTNVAKLLVEHGADLNAIACYRGVSDATPLFSACWSSGNVALVRWLLDQGGRPTDGLLMAALGHLQQHGRAAYDIGELLLDRGLSVEGGVSETRTPLHAFTHQADRRTVAWLIAHGAVINARGPGGRTSVHFAAERNVSPATLALLVENGADLAARDDDGRTPLEIAKQNEKTRLVEWITSRIRGKRR